MAQLRADADSPKTFAEILESTYDDLQRRRAIAALAGYDTLHACRSLLDAYEECMWRSTRAEIIRALATMRHPRALEHLYRLCDHRSDILVATQATAALSGSSSPAAARFLCTLAIQPEHPVCQEAISSLGSMRFFPAARFLGSLLKRAREQQWPKNLQDELCLAAASHGQPSAWTGLRALLQDPATSEELLCRSLFACAGLPASQVFPALNEIPTRPGSLADTLRTATQRTLARRRLRTLADTVALICRATSVWDAIDAIHELLALPPTAIATVIELHRDAIACAPQCFLRAHICCPSRRDSDLEFLADSDVDSHPDAVATLVGAYLEVGVSDFLHDIRSLLSDDAWFELLLRVPAPAELTSLHACIVDDTRGVKQRVQAINCLVAQARMGGTNAHDTVRDLLCAALDDCQPQIVAGRVVRALGQLEGSLSELLPVYQDCLADPAQRPLWPSVMRAVADTPGDWGQPLVDSQLQRISAGQLTEAEATTVYRALAAKRPVDAPEGLARVPRPRSVPTTRALLRVLSRTRCRAHVPLVNKTLRRSDFQTKILALSAATLNADEETVPLLLHLMKHHNISIAGRALHALCSIATPDVLKTLLSLCASGQLSDAQAHKVFRSMSPRLGYDYSSALISLTSCLDERPGRFAVASVHALAEAFRDKLDWRPGAAPNAKQGTQRRPKRDDPIEAFLRKQIADFDNLSRTLKSILFNAELTIQNPTLFNNRVDKSTAVIEYVKAMDLSLQESLGAQLLSDKRERIFAEMRSRVAHLRLDDTTVALQQRIRDLECEDHFTDDTFPAYKLTTLARSITTGQIEYTPGQTLDGLRAWALVLLSFCRQFTYRGVSLTPIFEMRCTDSNEICQLAARMLAVQQIRNRAAHRGTIVDATLITGYRSECIAVLNALRAAVAQPPA